jgi:hypothetical protein
VSGDVRRVIDAPTLAVKVPFARKLGAVLNGYRIGTYLAERLGAGHDRPDGFVEVAAHQLDLPLTKHFRLGDFLTHDAQESWPRYAAVSPKLLDKLELVLAEIARVNGRDPEVSVSVEVNSGFRTPLHNRRVRLAAGDSRHQYGDAADVKVDANFDGRFTAVDAASSRSPPRWSSSVTPSSPAGSASTPAAATPLRTSTSTPGEAGPLAELTARRPGRAASRPPRLAPFDPRARTVRYSALGAYGPYHS